MSSCPDQPTLFLRSPTQNFLGNDTFIFEEGRLFELECLSNTFDIFVRVERLDGVPVPFTIDGEYSYETLQLFFCKILITIITHILPEFGRSGVTLQGVVIEGDYACIGFGRRGSTVVRNFTVIVDRKLLTTAFIDWSIVFYFGA